MFAWLRPTKKHERLEREIRRLQTELLDKQAELEAAQRIIEIKDTEIAALAEVCARDRERRLAETEEFSRRLAGVVNER